jgi:hypothetical protein
MQRFRSAGSAAVDGAERMNREHHHPLRNRTGDIQRSAAELLLNANLDLFFYKFLKKTILY